VFKPDAGKHHSQTKFNPLDNDQVEANIISTDNLDYNDMNIGQQVLDYLHKNSVHLKDFYYALKSIVQTLY
jgi:hypothetical protein